MSILKKKKVDVEASKPKAETKPKAKTDQRIKKCRRKTDVLECVWSEGDTDKIKIYLDEHGNTTCLDKNKFDEQFEFVN